MSLAFQVKHLSVFYGSKQALFDININIPKNKVIAIIGPSGCGKSTFLRTLNRINDSIPGFKTKGKILLDGQYDIFKLKSVINRYDKFQISTLRTKVGMIFQQPNPFPMSIYKNVTYGPKIRGVKNKSILNDLVRNSLKDAGLYEEVKDNLKALGTSLSGGQQQRLCIARALANSPEILLMDEPTSALDPIASARIEELILTLKKDYTIIIVTHSMQQAARVSDYTAFLYEGRLIEYEKTAKLFAKPKQKETKEYLSGKFG
ncbi:MAG: phosphate ABC transporter ATP-binding protein [Mycoplasmataceae bacterium]|nr:phosphate ABC transporter ATP-binding protein [Mycoplasmataceae bacterium]